MDTNHVGDNMKRLLAAAVLLSVLALSTGSATAAKSPHRYAPRHGAHCHKTYKRVKHGRTVYCVKEKAKRKAATPVAPQTPRVKLHSHLDPTFTRDPLNPFVVTYSFSASATQETFSAQDVRLGEESAPLPSGVLSFYSDGKLGCAINVGGSMTGSECPVSYQALGSHTVTTIYSSGEQSATETEVENIGPLPTTTGFSATYRPLEHAIPTSKGEETGTLDLKISVSPPGAWDESAAPFHPECPPSLEPECIDLPYSMNGIPHELFHNGEASVPVYMNGSGTEVKIDALALGSSSFEVKWWPVSEIEDGNHYLRFAPNIAPGFTPSVGDATLDFHPEVIP